MHIGAATKNLIRLFLFSGDNVLPDDTEALQLLLR